MTNYFSHSSINFELIKIFILMSAKQTFKHYLVPHILRNNRYIPSSRYSIRFLGLRIPNHHLCFRVRDIYRCHSIDSFKLSFLNFCIITKWLFFLIFRNSVRSPGANPAHSTDPLPVSQGSLGEYFSVYLIRPHIFNLSSQSNPLVFALKSMVILHKKTCFFKCLY